MYIFTGKYHIQTHNIEYMSLGSVLKHTKTCMTPILTLNPNNSKN